MNALLKAAEAREQSIKNRELAQSYNEIEVIKIINERIANGGVRASINAGFIDNNTIEKLKQNGYKIEKQGYICYISW